MRFRLRHLRLRVTTRSGQFGADLPFDLGLNVLSAPNTTGKSTCLQSILYVLGLERMLSPRREIPLTYIMTSHLVDPTGGNRETIDESSVSLEVENGSGEVITVRRHVVASHDTRLVTVVNGPALTQPGGGHGQRDYFVRDPGSAQREAGFHRFLADFMDWSLPKVRRFDGSETSLYLETVFPLLYVEQKAGWSSLPAAFPGYFQIRDVSQRAIEFLLDLQTHELELRRQQMDLELAATKSAWTIKREELQAAAGRVNARVDSLPEGPPMSDEDVWSLRLRVASGSVWVSVIDVTTELRKRIAELSEVPVPDVESVATPESAEIATLTVQLAELNERRVTLFRARQEETTQRASVARRLAALEEDLQKNLDVQKLRDLGSAAAETLTADQCPTCAQPITDTLLAQRVGQDVMSVADNIEYIKSQRAIFQRLRDQSEARMTDLELELAASGDEVNARASRLRALRADLTAPANSPSVAAVEERVRAEARLEAVEAAHERFELQKGELAEIAASYASLTAARDALPQARLTEADRGKIRDVGGLIREQAALYGFSTFPPGEIEISEDNYRPQKEGFEIGFELSASDAIRLKWAYQLALLEEARGSRTNHPGFVIFDEPRQQETAKVSFAKLLERAALAKGAGQQVLFATSEDREELKRFLDDVDCQLIEFRGPIIQRL